MLTLIGSHSYAWQLISNLALCLAISIAVHFYIEKRFYRPRVLESVPSVVR
jgi:hypothetical protein